DADNPYRPASNAERRPADATLTILTEVLNHRFLPQRAVPPPPLEHPLQLVASASLPPPCHPPLRHPSRPPPPSPMRTRRRPRLVRRWRSDRDRHRVSADDHRRRSAARGRTLAAQASHRSLLVSPRSATRDLLNAPFQSACRAHRYRRTRAADRTCDDRI